MGEGMMIASHDTSHIHTSNEYDNYCTNKVHVHLKLHYHIHIHFPISGDIDNAINTDIDNKFRSMIHFHTFQIIRHSSDT